MIKATILGLVILLGLGLCAFDKADASGCGRAEVQAITCGAVHMRPGQVRRSQRRAARLHQSAQPAAKVEKAVKAAVEKPDLNAKTDPAKSTAAGVAASPTGAGQE